MLNRNKQAKFDGPIPGENYTSNTKNYPWHRPPTYISYPDIVDKAVQNLNKPERTALVIALLESNETIVDIVTGMTRIAVAQGRMSVDMAILAAGPIARMIEVIAEKADIEYDRGWDQEPRLVTSEMFKAMSAKVDEENADMSIFDTAEPEPEDDGEMGLMAMGDGPAAEEEQARMLGDAEEEEIV
jgi:hypothetical protein